jgi:Ca-activated chloride channel family protein
MSTVNIASFKPRTGVCRAGFIGLMALLLCRVPGLASPSSALREYKAGKYQDALKEYQRLLARNQDDPRLHFNAGTAAYESREFDEAAKQFNAARATLDVKLQELAYYNHGNSMFRLGEQSQDTKKRQEAWEQAVQDYESSVHLDAQDVDAKFNLEFVKKKLEELKQQQKQNDQQKNIQPSEDAKRAKAAADEAVQRRDYAGALDIMQKQLAKDPTTAYYNDYIQRLKEVNGVQEAPKQ